MYQPVTTHTVNSLIEDALLFVSDFKLMFFQNIGGASSIGVFYSCIQAYN